MLSGNYTISLSTDLYIVYKTEVKINSFKDDLIHNED